MLRAVTLSLLLGSLLMVGTTVGCAKKQVSESTVTETAPAGDAPSEPTSTPPTTPEEKPDGDDAKLETKTHTKVEKTDSDKDRPGPEKVETTVEKTTEVKD